MNDEKINDKIKSRNTFLMKIIANSSNFRFSTNTKNMQDRKWNVATQKLQK